MKTLLTIALMIFFGTEIVGADKKELEGVLCIHHLRALDNPTMNITFQNDDNDFVKVRVEERFTSKYFHDMIWAPIHEESEQVATSDKGFSIGVDGFSLVIRRPIPSFGTSQKQNATLEWGNGQKIQLHCSQKP